MGFEVDINALPTAPAETATPFDNPANGQGHDTGNGPANGVEATTEATEPASLPAGIDINSLDTFNDVETVDPNASITDQAPPPPDGIHVVRIRRVKDGIAEAKRVKDPRITDGSVGFFVIGKGPDKGKTQLMMCVEFVIDEDGKPWNKQSVREWVNTMLSQGVGTTAIDTLLRVTTGSAGVGMANGAKVAKLYQVLETEPQIKVQTQWIARGKSGKKLPNGKDEYIDALRGMKNFPKASNITGHAPIDTDPASGVEVRTGFEIKAYYPMSFAG